MEVGRMSDGSCVGLWGGCAEAHGVVEVGRMSDGSCVGLWGGCAETHRVVEVGRISDGSCVGLWGGCAETNRLICGYALQSGRSLADRQSFYDGWGKHTVDD